MPGDSEGSLHLRPWFSASSAAAALWASAAIVFALTDNPRGATAAVALRFYVLFITDGAAPGAAQTGASIISDTLANRVSSPFRAHSRLVAIAGAGVRVGRRTWPVDVASEDDRPLYSAFSDRFTGGTMLASGLLGVPDSFCSEFAVAGMISLGMNPHLTLLVATLENTLGAAVNWALGRLLLHF